MKKWLYPLSCLALVTVMSACGMNRNAAPNPGAQTQSLYQTYPSGGAYSNLGTGTTTPGTNMTAYGPYSTGTNSLATGSGFDTSLAGKAVRAADAVPGVDRAAAIVRGNDIIVGIRTPMKTASQTQRQVVERQVHSAVRAVAPNHKIHVTSESALLSRIDRLDATVRGGMTGANQFGTRNASGTAAGGTMANGTGNAFGVMSGPTTVTANLANAGQDFTALIRDLGRTVTAPFR